jgi:hypothetical protein
MYHCFTFCSDSEAEDFTTYDANDNDSETSDRRGNKFISHEYLIIFIRHFSDPCIVASRFAVRPRLS